MLETSASTEKLDAALAAAQGEIEPATKDKVNPHFKSKYADISAVWTAVRPALAKHGISATQWPIHSDDGRVHIVTRLAHSGEWMMARFSIPIGRQDPQAFGAGVTYAKRFALASVLGVVLEEDDDGNAATAIGSPPADGARRSATKPMPKPAAIESSADPGDQLKAYMLRSIDEHTDLVELNQWAKEHKATFQRLSPEAQKAVQEATERKRGMLAQAPAKQPDFAKLLEDEVPV